MAKEEVVTPEVTEAEPVVETPDVVPEVTPEVTEVEPVAEVNEPLVHNCERCNKVTGLVDGLCKECHDILHPVAKSN